MNRSAAFLPPGGDHGRHSKNPKHFKPLQAWKTLEQWENSGPGQLPIALAENLSAPDPWIERLTMRRNNEKGG